jgi:Uma2 family endonuclease
MSLADFEHAEVEEGHLYELGRGVVVVSDVPNPRHLAQVNAIRRQLMAYDLGHPGKVYAVVSGSECKVPVATLESERHPDLAVYLTAPPGDDSKVWHAWVPEVVVEVISAGSEERDYKEKREEYLAFGIKEYWVFDAGRQELLALRRRARKWSEKVVPTSETYHTRILPGFELNVGAVFEAARGVGR